MRHFLLLASVFFVFFSFCALPAQATRALPSGVQATMNPCAVKSHEPIIAVSGSGEVQAIPDRLRMRFGVSERTQNVREGSANMGKILGQALEFMKASGIDEKDIQTSHVNIQREYRFNNATNESVFVHYHLSQSFAVTLIDPSMYEKIFAGLIDLGINEVQEVSFSLSNPRKYFDEALGIAVRDAQRKAGVLADTTGLTLGSAVSIQEGRQEHIMPRTRNVLMAASADMASGALGGTGEGMALGTIPVRVEVSAVFRAN
jgi:hypothetical protein